MLPRQALGRKVLQTAALLWHFLAGGAALRSGFAAFLRYVFNGDATIAQRFRNGQKPVHSAAEASDSHDASAFWDLWPGLKMCPHIRHL